MLINSQAMTAPRNHTHTRIYARRHITGIKGRLALWPTSLLLLVGPTDPLSTDHIGEVFHTPLALNVFDTNAPC